MRMIKLPLLMKTEQSLGPEIPAYDEYNDSLATQQKSVEELTEVLKCTVLSVGWSSELISLGTRPWIRFWRRRPQATYQLQSRLELQVVSGTPVKTITFGGPLELFQEYFKPGDTIQAYLCKGMVVEGALPSLIRQELIPITPPSFLLSRPSFNDTEEAFRIDKLVGCSVTEAYLNPSYTPYESLPLERLRKA